MGGLKPHCLLRKIVHCVDHTLNQHMMRTSETSQGFAAQDSWWRSEERSHQTHKVNSFFCSMDYKTHCHSECLLNQNQTNKRVIGDRQRIFCNVARWQNDSYFEPFACLD